jgi:hypothetical protein
MLTRLYGREGDVYWIIKLKISECTADGGWQPQGSESVRLPRGRGDGDFGLTRQEGNLRSDLERYADPTPEMTELLRQADPNSLRNWTLYEPPVGCKWEHKKGLTLIRDAASLATPFAGD